MRIDSFQLGCASGDHVTIAQDNSTDTLLPPRMRGETFDQKTRVSYSFKDNEFAANLLAAPSKRTIVVQFDVAKTRTPCSYPPVSTSAMNFATSELVKIRRKFLGRRARLWRTLKGVPDCFAIEGPFLPQQTGVALLMLAVQVSRDANYDHAYQRIRQHLELHVLNDDRDLFWQQWYPVEAKPKPKPKEELDTGYPWTLAEFDAIERMARLESPCGSSAEDEAEMQRRMAYNQAILEKARGKRAPTCTVAEETNTDAAAAANKALFEFFCGR